MPKPEGKASNMKYMGYDPNKKGLQKFMSEEEELILKFLWSCESKNACLRNIVAGLNDIWGKKINARYVSRVLGKLEKRGFIKSEIRHSSDAELVYSTIFSERELLRELIYLTIKNLVFLNPETIKKAVDKID